MLEEEGIDLEKTKANLEWRMGLFVRYHDYIVSLDKKSYHTWKETAAIIGHPKTTSASLRTRGLS